MLRLVSEETGATVAFFMSLGEGTEWIASRGNLCSVDVSRPFMRLRGKPHVCTAMFEQVAGASLSSGLGVKLGAEAVRSRVPKDVVGIVSIPTERCLLVAVSLAVTFPELDDGVVVNCEVAPACTPMRAILPMTACRSAPSFCEKQG